jgi:hypothetical protein
MSLLLICFKFLEDAPIDFKLESWVKNLFPSIYTSIVVEFLLAAAFLLAVTAGRLNLACSTVCIRGMFSESHDANLSWLNVRGVAIYSFYLCETIIASVDWTNVMLRPHYFLQICIKCCFLISLVACCLWVKSKFISRKPSFTPSLRLLWEVSTSFKLLFPLAIEEDLPAIFLPRLS